MRYRHFLLHHGRDEGEGEDPLVRRQHRRQRPHRRRRPLRPHRETLQWPNNLEPFFPMIYLEMLASRNVCVPTASMNAKIDT